MLVVIRLETIYNVKANIYKCTTNLLLQFLSPRAAGDENLIYWSYLGLTTYNDN
jgi:hypothetical protein